MRTTEATVAPVNFRAARGAPTTTMYGVLIRVLPGSDEMWETMFHSAVFCDETRAAKMAARINAKRDSINFKHWVFRGDPCSPIAATEACFYSPLESRL